VNTVPVTAGRVSLTREVHRESGALLEKPHTLPTLLSALLFCLLATVTLYSAESLLYYTAYLVFDSAALLGVMEVVLAVLLGVAFWLLALPLWLAKLRMAGLLWCARPPAAKDIFYAFTDKHRYFRALRVGAVTLLLFLLPLLAVGAVFTGAYNLFKIAFSADAVTGLLLLLPLFVMALGLTVLVLFLSGLTRLFCAIAVGNEALSVRMAFLLAVRVGRKNLKTLFVFALKNLLWLLLSLLSVGVLYVLWFSHRYTLSYLRLSIILTSKENQI